MKSQSPGQTKILRLESQVLTRSAFGLNAMTLASGVPELSSDLT